tara:strand:+ start:3226 stop:4578 length:1353 start_codon:yes stop_codon:yes gene_type:complete
MKSLLKALTVAGSDSGGGAGIQADLKTFSAFGVFGTSAITSVTSQNSFGVHSNYDLPEGVVASQLKAVLSDEKPSAVKTGMLGNEAIVEQVVALFKKNRVKNLVVDPVTKSSSGKILLSKEGVEVMKKRLLPLAVLVTPNLSETQVLSKIRILRPADRLKAARVILETGVQAVLIKGGHTRGNADDFFFDGKREIILPSPRIGKDDPHGTGCALSAAITAGLAKRWDLLTAVEKAKDFMRDSIQSAVRSGGGSICVQPLAGLYRNRDKWKLFQSVFHAIETLKKAKIGRLIPEVQSNLGVGLKNASALNDVIGIPGRIIKKNEDIVTLESPTFGGSRHVADIVLTVMKHDPNKTAVMNIKYTDELLEVCRKLKFKIASFDRKREPKKVRFCEGSSLEWGTNQAICDYGSVPDIIYDLGGIGKEEMIRVIARDVESLVERILKIHKTFLKI